jgi:MFS family permease
MISVTQQKITRKQWRIIQYIVAVFLFWVSLYLYVPTLPVYIQMKTSDLAVVGIILGMYGFWQMVVRIPLGVFSDWVKDQKPLILIGFFLSGLGAVILAKAGNSSGLLLGRTVTALSASFWVILIVAFSRLFPPEEAVRATAILTLVNTLGRLVSSGLTGWLNDVGGYDFTFYFSAGVAVLALLVMLPGTERAATHLSPSLQTLKAMAQRPDVMIPSWLSVVSQYIVFGSTYGFIPILAAQMGASNVALGLMMSMNLLLITFGNLGVTRLTKRFSTSRIILISFIGLSLGLALAGFSQSLTTLFIAQAIIGAANGINYPTLMGLSIEKVEPRERSTAMGIHQSIYAIGMFAGPWLSGLLANKMGIPLMFILTGGICFGISLLGVKVLSNIRKRIPS